MNIMQTITDYIMKSILTTHGDLVVRGAALPERLAAVALGQVLKSGGVGAKPEWGVPKSLRISVGNTSTLSASGTTDITGLGMTPKAVIALTIDPGVGEVSFSVGFSEDINERCMGLQDNGAGGIDPFMENSLSGHTHRPGSNYMNIGIGSFAAGQFTITHTETGTCEAIVSYIAIGHE